MQTFLRRLRVGPRLLAAFASILIILIATVGASIAQLGRVRDVAAEVTGPIWADAEAANLLLEAVNAGAVAKLIVFATTDSVQRELASADVKAARNSINAAYAILDTAIVTPQGKALMDRILANRKLHAPAFDSAAALQASGRTIEAERYMTAAVLPTLDAYRQSIDSLIAYQGARMAGMQVVAEETYASARTTLIALALAGVVLAICLAMAIRHSIATPLADVVAVAERLAEGAVDVTIAPTDARDEVATLTRAMQRVVAGEQEAATAARRLAAGNVRDAVTTRGDADVIGRAMVELHAVLGALTTETSALSEAAEAGDLAHRANAARFEGAFGTLLGGMNTTLDSTTAPIAEARTVLERIAARDLTVRVTGQYHGDHAAIATAINAAASALEDAFAEVAGSAAQVAAAASQIAAGSQALAQGASEQAAALEETSASLHELSSMTTQNTTNAGTARGLAGDATGSARDGVERMQRLSAAMGEIQGSSTQTARIVKTIDEIAFQTNLLALNAAVEAARAGEHGRGFAVVADEVRTLAVRAAEAAKQTQALIEGSVAHVGSGVGIAGEVGTKLGEIASRVARMDEVMQEIAAGSGEQQQGVAQITSTLTEMNAVTQSVASSAEESAASAEELAAQAQTLQALVQRFRIGSRGPVGAGRLSARVLAGV